MKFIKNEIKLIGKVKIIMAILLSIVLTLLYYNKSILPKYENYYKKMQTDLQNVDTNLKAIDIYLNTQINDLSVRINKTEDEKFKENLKKEKEEKEDLKEKFENLKTNLSFVTFYRRNDPKELAKYREDTDKFIKDNFMDQMISDKKKIPIEGYGVEGDFDWSNRVLERAYLKENNIDFAKDKPYGAYVFKDFLNLNLLSASLIFLIILLIGSNIWSQDFEENEGKIILSLPYERSRIYRERFFTRFIISLIIIFLPILILSVFSGIKYGFGANAPLIVNKYMSENIFLNTSLDKVNQFNFLDIHMVFGAARYNLYLLPYFLTFIFMAFSLVNFFNIFTKNTIMTLGLILLMIFISIRSTEVSIYNILSYYNVKDIIYGFIMDGPYKYEVIEYGYGSFLLVMVLMSLVLYYLGKYIFKRQ